jgi:hypothetical protein
LFCLRPCSHLIKRENFTTALPLINQTGLIHRKHDRPSVRQEVMIHRRYVLLRSCLLAATALSSSLQLQGTTGQELAATPSAIVTLDKMIPFRQLLVQHEHNTWIVKAWHAYLHPAAVFSCERPCCPVFVLNKHHILCFTPSHAPASSVHVVSPLCKVGWFLVCPLFHDSIGPPAQQGQQLVHLAYSKHWHSNGNLPEALAALRHSGPSLCHQHAASAAVGPAADAGHSINSPWVASLLIDPPECFNPSNLAAAQDADCPGCVTGACFSTDKGFRCTACQGTFLVARDNGTCGTLIFDSYMIMIMQD